MKNEKSEMVSFNISDYRHRNFTFDVWILRDILFEAISGKSSPTFKTLSQSSTFLFHDIRRLYDNSMDVSGFSMGCSRDSPSS